MNPIRRQVLIRSVTAATAASLGLPTWSAVAGTGVDIHIELHAVPDQVGIRPGARTRVWRYRGRLLRGPGGALDTSMLAPLIRVRRGQRVRIDLVNGLPEPTIIHWHGLHVPDDMDGHPRFAVAPGARYVYEFTVFDRAGSYWFHAHPHGRAGKQVYSGLAGLFLVSDEGEAALGLPTGAQDIPIVIQDRNFDKDNQFVYLDENQGGVRDGGGMMGGGMMGGGMRSMMASMMGVLGDQILVNARPNASLDVDRRAHRLRLLNASNTRMYKLGWDDGSPLTVIGTDGGLLSAPVQRDYVMLAPAERVDLWVDFGRWPASTERVLRSLAFEGGMIAGSGGLADGAPFIVHRFHVRDGTAGVAKLPQRLIPVPPPQPRLAVNFDDPKVFEITMGMMTWGINGAGFDMLGVSALETVKLGTHEIWEFRNDGRNSMMGMVMPHSMHVHGLQFQVLGRSVSNKFAAEYDTVKAGLVDEGWKDTVLVMPGERVRILLRFADYPGLYLYHCHMLEHEDSGLMRNYLVKA